MSCLYVFPKISVRTVLNNTKSKRQLSAHGAAVRTNFYTIKSIGTLYA